MGVENALTSPSESDATTSTLCQLLHAYELAMLQAGRLPLFVLIPTAPLRPGFAGRLARLPRPRWFLRWFLTRHIRRTLEGLGRRYNARAGFSTLPPAMRRDQEAARSYLDSLPPTGSRVKLVLLAGVALAIGSRLVVLATTFMVDLFSTLRPPEEGGRATGRYEELADKVTKLLVPSEASTREALDALLRSDPAEILLFFIAVVVVLYVVLRPLTPSFRLKRMLFNCGASFDERRRVLPARWSLERACGVYRLERRVFEELRIAPFDRYPAPRVHEHPFDLAVGVGIALVAAVVGIDQMLYSRELYFTPGDLVSGALIVGLSVARLFWLRRAFRRRAVDPDERWFPFWIRLSGTDLPVKVENPWRIFIASSCPWLLILAFVWDAQINESPDTLGTGIFLLLVTSGPVIALWVYRVGRELGYLEVSCTGRQRRRGAKFLSAISMGAGWCLIVPPLITGYRIGQRVRTAQKRSGVTDRVCRPWVAAAGALPLGFPLLGFFLQRQLNTLWTSAGEVIGSVAEPCGSTTAPDSARPLSGTGD